MGPVNSGQVRPSRTTTPRLKFIAASGATYFSTPTLELPEAGEESRRAPARERIAELLREAAGADGAGHLAEEAVWLVRTGLHLAEGS